MFICRLLTLSCLGTITRNNAPEANLGYRRRFKLRFGSLDTAQPLRQQFTNDNTKKSIQNPSSNAQTLKESPTTSSTDTLLSNHIDAISEAKALSHARAPFNRQQDDMPSKTPHTNGTDPVENGFNGTKDVEMKDDAPAPLKGGKGKKTKEGEEEMTVVVPPSKGSKLSAPSKDTDGDLTMDGPEEFTGEDEEAPKVDPVAKAVAGT